MKSRLRSKLFSKAGLLGIATFAVMAAAAIGFSIVNNGSVAADDCSTNAIMRCGTHSPADFINKVKSSNNGQQTDLAAIYSAYGLAPADYSRFVSYAKQGTAYKDGRIVVDGRTVATNAKSIGRNAANQGAGYFSQTIGNKTYYGNSNSVVMLGNSMGVTVLFNTKGQMEFAVVNDCGNPTTGTPNNPTYACNNLITKQVAGTLDTFQFSTSASAGNGATINKVVYDFGDGTSATKTNPSEVVTHKYAKAGNYTAKVTVYVNVPGSQVYAIAAAGNCARPITVKPAPVAECLLLTAKVSNRTTVRLTGNASALNGATIKSYTYTVKNSAGKVVASKAVNSTSTSNYIDLTVADAGSYTANVVVATSLGNRGGSGKCATSFTIAPAPVAECKLLTVTPVDRTTFKLDGTGKAENDATIQGYDFTVKNSAGKVVASKSVNSTSSSASTTVTVTDEGTYTASVIVRTSLGNKGGSGSCAAPLVVKPVPVVPKPSVKIEKHVDNVKNKVVAVGQNFVYQVVVTNNGKVDLKNVVVTDPAPAGVTMLSADKGTVKDNKWSYTIPSLKIGESMSFNITAKVAEYKAGEIVNTACVNAPEVNPENPTKEDDCDTATITVVPPTPKNPNITITKTVDGVKEKQVNVGQNFVYQLIITNKGEIALTNAAVTDSAPDGVTLISADLGAIAGNTWTYTIPSLKVGESVTVNITAKVAAYTTSNMINTACVNAPEVNPENPDENDACDNATVTVVPPTTPPVTPPVMPSTGSAGTIGIFAGVSIFGAIGHYFIRARRFAQGE